MLVEQWAVVQWAVVQQAGVLVGVLVVEQEVTPAKLSAMPLL